MTTRVITSSLSLDATTTTTATTSRNGTTIIRSKSLPTSNYLVCDDPNNHSPFVNPTASSSSKKKGEKKNDDHRSSSSLSSPFSSFPFSRKIRRWPSRSSTYPWILQSIALFDTVFVSWWLMYVLNAYHEKVPLSTKRQITFAAWNWYVWMHTIVVCEWMGFYKNSSFYKSGIGDNDDDDSHNDDDDDDAISDEYKALSTLLYPTQFYPVSVPRMRFALSQLNVVSLNEIPSEDVIERIECDRNNVHNNEEKDGRDNGNVNVNGNNDTPLFVVPESQRDHQTVLGLYINNNNNKNNEKENSSTQKNKKVNNKKKVLFWIYGGAYLAGDAEGNLSLANEFMTDCDAASVFIPSYRLAPEATIDDALWDICWSYRYLLQRLQKQQEEEQQQEGEELEFEIVVVGISSGGALALRLLQLIRDRTIVAAAAADKKKKKKLPLMPSFLEPLIDDIVATTAASSLSVAGAVLFGPYVDYQDPQPSNGSFVQNAKYDWIVNEAVLHYGLPYLNGFIPPTGDDLLSNNITNTNNSNTKNSNTNGRIQYSPLSHEMNDLPPLCLIASEHEACYDMTIEVVNKVRRAKTGSNKSSSGGGAGGVDVTIGVWKHMCHVFSMCQAFLPEGKASIEFAKEWIRTKTIDGEE